MNLYEYKARVIRVIDGDTVELLVDLGFGVHKKDKFRIYGIDTPEVRYRRRGLTDEEWEAEKLAGKAASAYASELLPLDAEVIVHTHKDDQGKYGRYLAEIKIGEMDYAEEMIKAGHAQPYSV
jgi:micrococcal nuclease